MLVIVSSFHSAAPRSVRMSMQIGKENPISIAFGIERNSAMDRGDLANLSAFVTVADQRSFRAAASRLDVTRPALGQISDALEDLNRERSRPFGRLRIYATNMAGAGVIAPVWQRFGHVR